MPDSDTIKKIRRGLCEAEITTARFAHGRNVLNMSRKKSALKRYAAKLCDPVVKALFLASFLSLVIGFIGNGCAGTVGLILTVLHKTRKFPHIANGAERFAKFFMC